MFDVLKFSEKKVTWKVPNQPLDRVFIFEVSHKTSAAAFEEAEDVKMEEEPLVVELTEVGSTALGGFKGKQKDTVAIFGRLVSCSLRVLSVVLGVRGRVCPEISIPDP